MEFCAKEWLTIYNKVHSTGREINFIEKTANIKKDEYLMNKLCELKKEMEFLLKENNSYLEVCGLIKKSRSSRRINRAM